MSQRIGIVLFDGAEELDFVGPWEVFKMAATLREGVEVETLAFSEAPIRCAKGMRVLADARIDAVSELALLLVPGGIGTRREVENPAMIDWLRKVAPSCSFVTSVCTGSLLLCEAGLARGRRVTTHWSFVPTLRQRYADTQVLENVRYVRDGNLVTAAGVSAGIDMALWLCGQLWGVESARRTQRLIEYDPAPPYTAEV
jgi:transcriptional regulator GlxA family with amidase domain